MHWKWKLKNNVKICELVKMINEHKIYLIGISLRIKWKELSSMLIK